MKTNKRKAIGEGPEFKNKKRSKNRWISKKGTTTVTQGSRNGDKVETAK